MKFAIKKSLFSRWSSSSGCSDSLAEKKKENANAKTLQNNKNKTWKRPSASTNLSQAEKFAPRAAASLWQLPAHSTAAESVLESTSEQQDSLELHVTHYQAEQQQDTTLPEEEEAPPPHVTPTLEDDDDDDDDDVSSLSSGSSSEASLLGLMERQFFGTEALADQARTHVTRQAWQQQQNGGMHDNDNNDNDNNNNDPHRFEGHPVHQARYLRQQAQAQLQAQQQAQLQSLK